MKKIAVICLVLAMILSSQPVLATETAEDGSVVNGCRTLDGQVPLLGDQQLIKNAEAIVLYAANADTLMYAYNADTQLPPSSLLKILTALIAIENSNLTDAVTVREEVLDTLDKDAAVVELAVDEVLTVEDLLYCMMVGSGNDAAVILADYVLGSQETFVSEMNRYATELGCTGTNFTNVHGLHDENQFTTARDVARIVKKAIENETFCEIFGAKYYSVPKTNKAEERHLESQNYLMNNDHVIIHYDERVTGSRTAVAHDRSRSIASVASVGDMQLICVVMGSDSVYEKDGYTVKVFGGYDETKKMLDNGFSGYKTAQILYDNQIVLQKSVANGSSDLTIGTREGAFTVVPENTTIESLSFRYANEVPLEAPIKKGQKICSLQVWCGAVCIAETDLFAMNQVFHINDVFTDTGTRSDGPGFGKVLIWTVGGIVTVILLGFAVLAVIRSTHISKAKRRSIRHRRNRRRSI